MKVALVWDWLTGYGGAERILLELHQIFPEAPIYTSQYNPKKIDWFKDADVRTTWLNIFPSNLKKFLPVLRALAFSHLDLSSYDLVISVTGAEAKAVKIGPKTVHVCICNAPTHYYWSRYDQYIQNPGFGFFNPVARLGLKILVKPMQGWDRKAAQKPTYMVAISSFIKREIKKYYGRDSEVIYPPVNIDRFKNSNQFKRSGFLVAGRQTPYKRLDLAVQAATKANLPLTVIGKGPQHEDLVKLAGPSVTFAENVSDKELPHYFAKASAFIFPGLDDFGIVAVEALAAGTPVIAYRDGGALDYIIPGKNGHFFDQQTVDSLANVMQKFKASSFDNQAVARSAEKFSQSAFKESVESFLARHLLKSL